jgi:hypothetical protein
MQPGKAVCAIFALAMIASPAAAQDIDFGDDSGEYASDGECDDPRFTGPGTPTSLSVEHTLRDATDCRRLFGIGAIRLVRQKGEASVAECAAINFGDNSSRWANDGERSGCADPARRNGLRGFAPGPGLSSGACRPPDSSISASTPSIRFSKARCG